MDHTLIVFIVNCIRFITTTAKYSIYYWILDFIERNTSLQSLFMICEHVILFHELKITIVCNSVFTGFDKIFEYIILCLLDDNFLNKRFDFHNFFNFVRKVLDFMVI